MMRYTGQSETDELLNKGIPSVNKVSVMLLDL